MSGYRQSSFDPSAGGDYGPPLRPFNWVQWTGVGLGVLGVVALVADILGRMGVIPKVVDDPFPFVSLMPIGAVLINSRRQPACLSPETKRRRIIIAAVALVVFAIALGVTIYFEGA